MRPISIKRKEPGHLVINWENGHESIYSLKNLRDACPCATCAGESILFKEYKPVPRNSDTPGRYELKSITPVGSYAVQIAWGDGHNAGIYSWHYLLSECQSENHSKTNNSDLKES